MKLIDELSWCPQRSLLDLVYYLKKWQGNYMEDKELNIVDHLDELRTRLIVTACCFYCLFCSWVYVCGRNL